MTKWLPAGNKILVKCDPIEKTFKKGGVIEVPHGTVIERQEMKQMMGTVVAMGPLAYNDQRKEEYYATPDGHSGAYVVGTRYVAAPWVQVGDRVKFTQFAGYLHEEEGDDAKYRVMHDLDIIMVYKPEQEDGNE